MNPQFQPPSDPDLDRLLASKLKHTSPEFELRWRELRGRLVQRTAAPRLRFPRWLFWPGFATAALAAVAITFNVWHSRERTATDAVLFGELFALDAALAPASVLFDAENRDVVIHLSVPPNSSRLP
jgi:hypothetical protein